MKTLFTRLFALLIALSLSSHLYAQSNFENGYIIMPGGETVYGLIDNRQWELHPTRVAFKTDENVALTWYVPGEILGFGVAGFVFISRLVEIDDVPFVLENKAQSSEPNMIEKHLFLQVIYQGDKSLYYHKDENSKVYFFIEQDGVTDWLYYKRYMNISESVNRSTRSAVNTRSINTYKGQLQLYFNDCSDLKSRIEKADYTLTHLYRIFDKYYELCYGNIDFKMERIKPAIKYRLDLLAGFTHTSLNFEGTVRSWLYEPDFPASIDFTGGIGFEIRLPHNNYKSSLYNELLYNQMSTEASLLFYSMGPYATYKHSSLDFRYIKLKSLYQHNLQLGQARLFANAGLGIGFLIGRVDKLITEYLYNDILTEQEVSSAIGAPNIRGFDPGLIIGLGANYQKFNIRGQYELSKGPSKINGLGSVTTHLSLTLGYSILH